VGDDWRVKVADPAPYTIFNETFPVADAAWDGSSDTAQNEPGWVAYQGADGDTDDVRVAGGAAAAGSLPPSGGNALYFIDCDTGFASPKTSDLAYVSIDLSGYTGVVISFYWQETGMDAGEGFRAAYSTNSTDGKDGTWTIIFDSSTDASAQGTWYQTTYNLPDHRI